MAQKEIIVILPVYNNQAGFEKTLTSLLPEKDLYDVMVIDDGSKVPVDTIKFPELTLIQERVAENKGLEDALNFGLKYVLDNNYKYIARIDAGDRAINGRFGKQLKFMEENLDVGVLSNYFYLRDGNTIIGEKKLPTNPHIIAKKMHYINIICHSSAFCRAEIVRKVGFISKEFKAAEDYEYWMRAKKISKLANYPEPLLEVEYEPDSVSHKNYYVQKINTLRVQLKYFDFLNIWSYLGVIRSLMILSIPRNFRSGAKKVREFFFNIKSSPYNR